jgi:hypothetical protein
MSFVNMMADDFWSDGDIVNRTEAVIAETFPPARAEILRRKVMGQMLGQYALTADEQAEMQQYAVLSAQAGALADAARADMALLRAALTLEAAQRRLALEPVLLTEDGSNQADADADAADRAAAQAVVDGAAQPVLDLAAQRAAARAAAEPAPEPTPGPQP